MALTLLMTASLSFSPSARSAAEKAWHNPSKVKSPDRLIGAAPQFAGAVGGSTLAAAVALSVTGAPEHSFSFQDGEFLAALGAAAMIILPFSFYNAGRYYSEEEANWKASEADACLLGTDNSVVDQMAEAVCGSLSFDSTEDGMMCIETNVDGKLRWVCA